MAVFLMAFLGNFYSCASWQRSFGIFEKYARLGAPIFFVPFFIYEPKALKYLAAGVLSGLTLFVIYSSIPVFWPHQTLYHYHWYLNPIYVSLVFAMICTWTFNQNVFQKNLPTGYRLAIMLLIVTTTFYLFAINPQKTGIVVLVSCEAMAFLCIVLGLRKKRLIVWALFNFLLLGLVFFLHLKFAKNSKLTAELNNLLKAVSSQGVSKEIIFSSSIEARTDLIKACFILFKERPLVGHGTGSLATLFEKKHLVYLENRLGNLTDFIANPHNEWMHTLVQWGSIGGILIAFWLFAPFYFGLKHHFFVGDLLLLFLWPMELLIGGTADSVLFISITRDFYVLTLSALFAYAFITKTKRTYD